MQGLDDLHYAIKSFDTRRQVVSQAHFTKYQDSKHDCKRYLFYDSRQAGVI